MEKVYKYENATIYVTSTKSCDQQELVRSTEEFVRKVIRGGKVNGYFDKTRNLSKK